MVDLDFSVDGAEALAFAALPTMAFKLHVRSNTPEAIRALSLSIQVRIAATLRSYTRTEQDRLFELFGEPSRWGKTLRSLLWTTLNFQVPPFDRETRVDMPMPCTYDFEVVATKYFDALEDGQVPLEFLFSGTAFYTTGDGRLQVEQVGWDKEARYALPVRAWKDLIQLYFPNTAWLRVHKDAFNRLYEYRMRNAFPTWEAALDSLLERSDNTLAAWTH